MSVTPPVLLRVANGDITADDITIITAQQLNAANHQVPADDWLDSVADGAGLSIRFGRCAIYITLQCVT